MEECILSRRDQMKVAWQRSAWKKEKSGTRPEGTVDLLTSPRGVAHDGDCTRISRTIQHYYCLFFLETKERRMTHFQETLINRPYGTGRFFFLFSRHFVPGYPRFNPSGINA
jgi:hypothetical protein